MLSSLPPELMIPGAISIFLAVLVGMTIHEFAHNFAAHQMGDPTPAQLGRLTLNPLVHINIAGFLMFVVLGFGILGSAPIRPYLMRNPRLGSLVSTAAGPFSNLLLAIAAAIIYQIVADSLTSQAVFIMIYLFIYFNVLLFVFNLLPLFPLDGWHIVLALLPPELAQTWQRHAQTTQYIFMGMLLLSFVRVLPFDPFGIIIGQPVSVIIDLLMGF